MVVSSIFRFGTLFDWRIWDPFEWAILDSYQLVKYGSSWFAKLWTFQIENFPNWLNRDTLWLVAVSRPFRIGVFESLPDCNCSGLAKSGPARLMFLSFFRRIGILWDWWNRDPSRLAKLRPYQVDEIRIFRVGEIGTLPDWPTNRDPSGLAFLRHFLIEKFPAWRNRDTLGLLFWDSS